ncbi:MAG TPA: hypothetical protein VFT60_12745 [Bryobacteraceae bacterium]|nr:hypothetical protein [Bryobacteraceae bacterium]
MKRNRNSESGYALLMIFAMAAILAITLYTEIPRVAFEAQRDKEQLLIDRGEEYQRAVTLFVRKFNRFPASMEELENTNGQRFLRRRFVDPMTGKNEWRIIHAGPGGVLTDSVDSKAQDQKDEGTQQNFITDIGLTSSSFDNQANTGQSVNLATRRRPSDSGVGGGVGGGGDDGGNNTQTSNTGIPGYNGPVMVLPDGRIVPANTSGTYTPPANGAAGASGRVSPMPGMPPGMMPPGSRPPGMLPPGAAGVPGATGPVMPGGVAVQQGLPPGAAAPGPPGAAASLIQQILTHPRQPGGFNGPAPFGALGQQGQQLQQAQQQLGQTTSRLQGQPQGTAALGQAPPQQQQNVIGAGIAGVASKKEGESIKTVNDHTKYNEWEFVYDITKDPARQMQGRPGAAGASGAQGRGGGNNSPGINPMMPGGGPQGASPMIPPGGALPGMLQGPGRGGPGRGGPGR